MEASIQDLELSYKRKPIIFVDRDAPIYPSDLPGAWFVADCEATDSRKGLRRWLEMSRTPFKTNMSQQERIRGWLGNTSGIDREAVGAVRCSVRTGKAIFRKL